LSVGSAWWIKAACVIVAYIADGETLQFANGDALFLMSYIRITLKTARFLEHSM
jgi:hypothetical protein